MPRQKAKAFIWVKVRFFHGYYRWYCLSYKVRKAAFESREMDHNDTSWRSRLLYTYINVAVTPYTKSGKVIILPGRIVDIDVGRDRGKNWHWTRSQFITNDKLKNDFENGIKYMQHDYGYLSKILIKHTLKKWQSVAL